MEDRLPEWRAIDCDAVADLLAARGKGEGEAKGSEVTRAQLRESDYARRGRARPKMSTRSPLLRACYRLCGALAPVGSDAAYRAANDRWDVSSTIRILVVSPAVYGVIKGCRLPAIPVHQSPDRCVEEPRRLGGRVS